MSQASDNLYNQFKNSIPTIEQDVTNKDISDLVKIIVSDIQSVEGTQQSDVVLALDKVGTDVLGLGFIAMLAWKALVSQIITIIYQEAFTHPDLVNGVAKATQVVNDVSNDISKDTTPKPQ